MGDAGALFLGFMLAYLGMKLRFDAPDDTTFMVPILVMGLAIFDTCLVTITRLRRGVSPFLGGRDHTSHRLVRIGLPVPAAVALMYTVGICLGLVALVMSRIDRGSAYLLVTAVGIMAVMSGVTAHRRAPRRPAGERGRLKTGRRGPPPMLTRWPNRAARRTARRARRPRSPPPTRPSRLLRARAAGSTIAVAVPPRGASRPPKQQQVHQAPPSGSALSPMLIAGLGLSGFWLLLGVTGVLSTFGLALFLVALSWAVLAVAQACRELWDPTDALRSARRVVSFIVVLALPVAFDPGTAERYGVSKFTVLMIGALVLAGLWVVDAVTNVTIPSLRTGLHWPILAMVVVGGLATIFSVSPKLSLIGAYQSYDGYLALVSFAVLALVAAESWRPSDLRRILTTFLLASGGLVVLYGLIQTADVELSTHWDWIQFLNVQASFGPTSSVWSTFGNPNHLAGFVACLLPIGIIAVISDKSLVTRILAGAVLAGGLLCLVETSSLGGLGAGFGALVLTALLLIPELRARKRMAAWLGAGVAVAVVVAVVIVAAQGTLGHKIDAATEWSSGTSTAAQRVQFWHSALDMAADRPLLGWGPDTFGYMAPTYQTQKFVDAFGPDQVINGAHNTFAQTLATKGILGLAALLFFLVWLGLARVGRLEARTRP